jgi:ABC-2 type transport system permease protein
MWAEYKNTLRKLRGAIIGWGIGLFAYTLMIMALFETIAEVGLAYMSFVDAFPKEMWAFFPYLDQFQTPVGYLDTYFFGYINIIMAILMVGMGAKLIVKDEEEGVLDLTMAYPISRTNLFWARVLAAVTAVSAILLAAIAGWLLVPKVESWTLSTEKLLLAHLPLLALLLLFGALALLFSLVLPSVKAASGAAGGLMVANYLLNALANLDEKLQAINKFTPFYYYQGGGAVDELNWGYLAGMLGAALLLTLLAWWRFSLRDIRVGGEAGWELPRWLTFKKQTGNNNGR